jgi:hypothetical protein
MTPILPLPLFPAAAAAAITVMAVVAAAVTVAITASWLPALSLPYESPRVHLLRRFLCFCVGHNV